MVSAEFESMSKLYEVMPELVAKPIAWGEYQDTPDTYFFLCEYYKLRDDAIPDKFEFPALLAEFHQRPAGISPDGKFGFPIITWGGRHPVCFPMSDTWEECFSQAMEKTFAAELETQGPNAELEELERGILEKVIPRLLRPLETEGRKITPQLCHGDLWDGNASVDEATAAPKIFDPTPVYAHKEYELAPWWVPRHRMTEAEGFITEYTKHSRISEPVDDFSDRGILYSLRFDIHASSLYSGNLMIRNIAMGNMRRLVEKYGHGYEGYLERKAQLEKTALDDAVSELVPVMARS